MDPLTLMALAQGAMGVGQKVASGIQRRKAEKNFTPYEIPTSANLALDRAYSLASQTDIPGADIYRSRAQSNAAQSIEAAQRTAGSTGDVLAALPSAQANLDTFYQDIAAKGAGYYQQNQAQLQNALNTMAGYETERWRQNEYMPYMQALQTSSLTGQAGNQNIGSAIGAGMNIGLANWETENMNKRWDAELNRKYPRDSYAPIPAQPSRLMSPSTAYNTRQLAGYDYRTQNYE